MDIMFPIPPIDEKFNDEIFPHSKKPNVEKLHDSNISEAVERYFQSYSPKTVIAYKADLKTWWQFSQTPVRDTTPDLILKYIKYLEGQGFQNATINRKIASLSKIFSIYVHLGVADSNPIQILAATTKIYKPTSPEVRNTLGLHDVEKVILNASKRTSVIVKFLANTGLRISEMINITKSDLEPKDTSYLSIRIVGKGKKVRFIYIPYTLYEEVKDVVDSDCIYLFSSRTGKKLSRVNMYKQIKRAFEKYAQKTSSPHQLRHFFATRKIIHEGKDYKSVSSYLGHANVGITLECYVSSQLMPEDTQII